ncbi:MAG: pyridoxamine 5'-phosphate oxidase [Actinomycetota bacterium]
MSDEPYARTLTRRDLDPDPFAQFRTWLEAAEAAGVRMPNAMTLATASPDGRPSARSVLLRGLDERGFVFFTNYESRKGRQLSENPHAALVFLWKDLERQVCVTGAVERTSREESEEYFRTRPRDARLGAWASRQSAVIGSRAELDTRFEELARRNPGENIPLPPFWGGFRLFPDTIEFWQGRPHRLHDRFRYSRQPEEGWLIERLSP